MIHSVAFRLALRDLLASRKVLFAGIVSLVPALLALLAFLESRSFADEWSPILGPGLLFVGLSVSIPVVCLILAGGLIADEAEDRTLSYLLVRPVPRAQLYLSRGLAVFLVALVLVVFQVFTTWLVDAIAYLDMAQPGQRIEGYDRPGSVAAGALLAMSLPMSLAVGVVAAALYTALFGAGSVIFPRYHFFGNLTFFAIWEMGIGTVPIPTAWLSGNHALRAWYGAMDQTTWDVAYASGPSGWLGLPVAFLFIGLWVYVGARVMARRDFHVTSAAT